MKKSAPPSDPRIAVAGINAKAKADLEAQRIAFETRENELERRNKLVIAAIDERLQSTSLTSAEKQTLARIKGTLAGKVMEVRAQTQLSREAIRRPAVEPVGRAPNGQAFHR